MGNIIEFNKQKKEIEEKKKILKSIFEELFKDEKKVRNKYMYELQDDSFDDLLLYVDKVYDKLNRTRWIDYNKIDNFIDIYKGIKVKEEEHDILNITFKRALFICLCDKNEDILNEDKEKIFKVIDGVTNGIDDIYSSNISSIADKMFDDRIEETIKNTKKDSDFIYSEIAYGLSEGMDLSSLLTTLNKKEEKADDPTLGIQTIDRYKKYYLNAADFLYYALDNYITEIDINNISIMDKINNFNEIPKLQFLKIISEVTNGNYSIADKTVIASELTHYYMVNKNNIDSKKYENIYNDVVFTHEFFSDYKPKKK